MDRFDGTLFLGFPVTPDLQAGLSKVDPEERSFFVNSSGDYLAQAEYQGMTYLGKKVGASLLLDDLPLLEAHLASLLHRLVPDYSYGPDALVLLPLTCFSCQETS